MFFLHVSVLSAIVVYLVLADSTLSYKTNGDELHNCTYSHFEWCQNEGCDNTKLQFANNQVTCSDDYEVLFTEGKDAQRWKFAGSGMLICTARALWRWKTPKTMHGSTEGVCSMIFVTCKDKSSYMSFVKIFIIVIIVLLVLSIPTAIILSRKLRSSDDDDNEIPKKRKKEPSTSDAPNVHSGQQPASLQKSTTPRSVETRTDSDKSKTNKRVAPMTDSRGKFMKMLQATVNKQDKDWMVKMNVLPSSVSEADVSEGGGLEPGAEYRIKGLSITEKSHSQSKSMATVQADTSNSVSAKVPKIPDAIVSKKLALLKTTKNEGVTCNTEKTQPSEEGDMKKGSSGKSVKRQNSLKRRSKKEKKARNDRSASNKIKEAKTATSTVKTKTLTKE